ncbi:hypothetical protein PACILC2_35660 [Paenibacillus cisolokensis]|uniref:Uncharacterized protein n=1 Tax=Paenibacillus cisolokensis TaxID=1658519 RepID=A0ABQ4NAK5_9BACL|nr:hypothetical protein PACILC2_35660 [Paenibacillus cisolokensis]
MQMRRKFALGARFAVAGTADPADNLAGLQYIADFDRFVKAGKMGVVMIIVVQIAYADSPASVRIPAFDFHDAVTGAAHGHTVRCENIGSFMDPSAAPTAACPPGAAV